MEKTYRVEPYQVPIEEDFPFDGFYETRFRIVSVETGQILDDAQGYGYKTAQKAHAAYSYKARGRSKDRGKQAKDRKIRRWMQEHQSFVELMEDVAVHIAKGSYGPDAKFDQKIVSQMLDEHGLHPEFSAGELLAAWKRR